MPNSKSAVKRMRQSLRRRDRNKAVRTRLKSAVKSVRAASQAAEATDLFRQAATLLDRAAARGLIHQTRASRSKARLAAHVRRLGGTA